MSGIRVLTLGHGGPEHIAAISAGQKAAFARRQAGEGFIYVCAIRDTDAIKVGFSLNPENRVLQLGAGVRLLGYFPADVKTERALHVRLRAHRHPDFPRTREVYRREAFSHDLRPDIYGPAPRRQRGKRAEAA